MELISEEDMKNDKFIVHGDKFATICDLKYLDMIIPKGFLFDGVTIIAPFGFLFSNKDLNQGLEASCFHDFMCLHKDKYSRKQATKVLIDIWRDNGLENFKASIAKFAVNIYQWFKGWK